jgi:tRNA pseudouridine38-40 synthase
MERRYFIELAYDGTNYCGWQAQPNGVSVQETLERALSTILRQETGVTGAGRTDAGVHARLMTAHFDAETALNTEQTADKLNRLLPPDVSIRRIRPVQAEAHARFDAISRTYQYHLFMAKDPFGRLYQWRIHSQPDFQKMNEAAQILLTQEDFTSFSKLHTNVKTNNCRVTEAFWEQADESSWVFTIKADRFLRNMVRAIVGTLLEVGRGKMSPEEFRSVILQRDRCKAGSSVPAQGLFLVGIEYPETLYI